MWKSRYCSLWCCCKKARLYYEVRAHLREQARFNREIKEQAERINPQNPQRQMPEQENLMQRENNRDNLVDISIEDINL